MPHVIIEYSDILEAHVPRRKLLKTAHEAVAASDLFDVAAIRSRTQSFDNYHLGSGKHNFLHVTIKLLSGRTDEQKTHLTSGVVEALRGLALTDVSLSCECVDLDNTSYQRVDL